MKRGSGILLPISSLPSDYGIGTLGKEARKFADFLAEAKQKYWQILPVGPTSYGDSPYQSFSTFAGNPYFIDLDMLIKDGLLKKKEVESAEWGTNPRYVDYGKMYISKLSILRKAYERGFDKDEKSVKKFAEENSWVENYALFMAVKKKFNQVCWLEWADEDIRLHKPEAVEKYKKELKDDVDFFIYTQYLFFKQWDSFKAYVAGKGIKLIGDLPIYVALDSADVWAEPEMFMLDEENYPVEVSGVPPDYFSETGQLWGNPIYNWEKMKEDDFDWWVKRVAGAKKLFDVIRIDHFRGFDEYWSVPYGENTAINGQWKKGPGMELVGLLSKIYSDIEFIAEDLGSPSPTVVQLLKDSKWPGMKVLEFAFDSGEPGDYMPHRYTNHCVCYTGTHDNATLVEWMQSAEKSTINYARSYFGIRKKKDFAWGMIKGGMRSVSDLFVAQMQDYLGLGQYNRINVPGTASGNWQWRMLKKEANSKLAKKIAKITVMYDR